MSDGGLPENWIDIEIEKDRKEWEELSQIQAIKRFVKLYNRSPEQRGREAVIEEALEIARAILEAQERDEP